ncbi:MAG: hydrogenase small subunit [Phycisphaerae bacterium]|nr:hydrogenase small subunit [Phycisphaerae bacterium]
MGTVTRRTFLKTSTRLAAVLGLGSSMIPQIAEAVEQLYSGNAPLIWLEGQGCTGCSVSLLNTDFPSIAQVLTQRVSLKFHSTVSAATGEVAVKTIHECVAKGGHFLAIEGSIPVGMPEACVIAEKPFTQVVLESARTAQAVIAVGTCASFGGIPAAENNPTQATSVSAFLASQGVKVPVINLPGCPCHPDWLIGTIVHVLKFGIPALDEKSRPKAFYGKLIHDQCPRFADYEREKFAKSFSDDGCMFHLGCMGTQTHADCTMRMWNCGTNSCLHSGSICIGCAWEGFTAKQSFPIYRKLELQTTDHTS